MKKKSLSLSSHSSCIYMADKSLIDVIDTNTNPKILLRDNEIMQILKELILIIKNPKFNNVNLNLNSINPVVIISFEVTCIETFFNNIHIDQI